MTKDVQEWLDNPSSNFGWIVIGDEVDSNSVRRFSTSPGTEPVLEVEFTPVPVPAGIILMGVGLVCLAFYRRPLSRGSLRAAGQAQ
jgi:hypothetical protein